MSYMISLSRVFVCHFTYTTMKVDWCYLLVRRVLNLFLRKTDEKHHESTVKSKTQTLKMILSPEKITVEIEPQ